MATPAAGWSRRSDCDSLGASIYMAHREELKRLLTDKSLVRGDFVLSSGQRSNYYLDCKLTTLDPRGAYLTGEVLLELLESTGIKADAIGGMTMGADPLVSAVAVVSELEKKPLPAFLIRKEAKKHGKMKQIEGIDKTKTRKVVIVDEVCTTGKSTQEAIDAAVQEGYEVVAVISLVDREEGGSEILRSNYNYHAVFTASELLRESDERSSSSTSRASQIASTEAAIRS